jgi:hypothetical protein
LWEESWDDDDAAEDFSKQLRYVSFNPVDSGYSTSGARYLGTLLAARITPLSLRRNSEFVFETI